VRAPGTAYSTLGQLGRTSGGARYCLQHLRALREGTSGGARYCLQHLRALREAQVRSAGTAYSTLGHLGRHKWGRTVLLTAP